MFWALLALIVFRIVLVLVQIPGGAVIYAAAGLVIFAVLDALNVFLLFVSIFSGDE